MAPTVMNAESETDHLGRDLAPPSPGLNYSKVAWLFAGNLFE